MELIIRVTGRCNFDCTFCSATTLDIAHPKNGVPEQIKEVINTIHPSSIVISGGEPLLVGPEYFLELYDLAKCNISITTNLKDFYYNPEKWREVFTHPNIGIVTSFNYGDTRRWDVNTVYDEEMFIKIYNMYHEMTGKSLLFIAVLDESNEHLAIKHAELAKRLNTCVRINNATKQGRQYTTYPRYKLFQKYFDIIDAGLGDYEIYCKKKQFGKCPINTNMMCKSTIRTCYVDSKDVLHYYDCCEACNGENLLNFKNDYKMPVIMYPPMKNHVNANCACCELFAICNGCDSQKRDYPPEHCQEMLKMKNKFIENGWIKELI